MPEANDTADHALLMPEADGMASQFMLLSEADGKAMPKSAHDRG